MQLEAVLARTKLEHRPYHSRLIKKTRKMFNGTYVNGSGKQENAAKSILIESPPGSGKTSIMLVQALLEQMQNNSHVIWVAMRRNLLIQAASENAPPSATNPTGKNICAKIDFLSMFSHDIPPHLLPENRDVPLLLVCDEAHHDAANTMVSLHNKLRPTRVLGGSATPWRADRMKLHFEKVIRDIGIRELIAQGYLSQYDHYTIPKWNPEQIADFYAKEPQRWGQSVAFFHQQDSCRRFNRRLTEHGIPSDVVTADTDREQQIEDLATGKVAVLASCAVLTEGFNYPDLKTVFVRDSGRGCTIQMGGRAFRKSDLYPIKQIVQSQNTAWPFLKTALPVQQLVWKDERWLTLTINPHISEISNKAHYMIANSPMDIPSLLRTKSSKKKRNRF